MYIKDKVFKFIHNIFFYHQVQKICSFQFCDPKHICQAKIIYTFLQLSIKILKKRRRKKKCKRNRTKGKLLELASMTKMHVCFPIFLFQFFFFFYCKLLYSFVDNDTLLSQYLRNSCNFWYMPIWVLCSFFFYFFFLYKRGTVHGHHNNTNTILRAYISADFILFVMYI